MSAIPQAPALPPAGATGDSAATVDVAAILARAEARVDAPPSGAKPYAGAVTPTEAWQSAGQPGVHVVDVRSPEEHRYVGHVPGSRLVVWRGTSDEQVAQFIADLREQVAPQDTVLLLCRSSVRSVRAATAATREGFTRMFNILEGFEGKLDEQQQRGKIDGWRKAGLPWKQE